MNFCNIRVLVIDFLAGRDEDMLTGLEALAATDWNRLHHAYGRASDTPGHLRALLEDDAAARKEALDHLWSAIIHQGTPWTATGPVALVVAGFLVDQRIGKADPTLRSNLISFLSEVAEAPTQFNWNADELEHLAACDIDVLLDAEDQTELFEDEEATQTFFARAALGCMQAIPGMIDAMLKALEDSNPTVRACGAMGASALFKHAAAAVLAPEIPEQLLRMARRAENADERAALVLALGEMEDMAREFLNDAVPAVRMCAALAPRLENDAQALGVLIWIFQNHVTQIDGWFTQRPPQFSMHPRFYVVARLIQANVSFEVLAEGAQRVVGITSMYAVDEDWGPLLAAAFADGSGRVGSEPQRVFLRALVERKDLWDPVFGNPRKWFDKAGLTYDRDACAQRLAGG
jgi:hypothetical protein